MCCNDIEAKLQSLEDKVDRLLKSVSDAVDPSQVSQVADDEGDVWLRDDDGYWYLKNGMRLVYSFEELKDRYGPLTAIK